MKASNITKVVNKLIVKKLPVFIWGAPGIGKSSIVKQIAAEQDLEFLDLRLSLLDPTDLKGSPFFNAAPALLAKPFIPLPILPKKFLILAKFLNTTTANAITAAIAATIPTTIHVIGFAANTALNIPNAIDTPLTTSIRILNIFIK